MATIKKIEKQETEVEVYKLPLKKYDEFLQIAGVLPERILAFFELPSEQVIPGIPKLIKENLQDFKKILVLATNLTEEQVDELALDEIIEIIQAVYDVNRYNHIWSEVKKVVAQPMFQGK